MGQELLENGDAELRHQVDYQHAEESCAAQRIDCIEAFARAKRCCRGERHPQWRGWRTRARFTLARVVPLQEDTIPAFSSAACNRTLTPALAHSGKIVSVSLWLVG